MLALAPNLKYAPFLTTMLLLIPWLPIHCPASVTGAEAGFCPPCVTPWIDVNPDHVNVNAESQRDDPDSVFAHYRRLVELRHREPVVALGDFTMLLPHDEAVYAFTRELDGVRLLVLAVLLALLLNGSRLARYALSVLYFLGSLLMTASATFLGASV